MKFEHEFIHSQLQCLIQPLGGAKDRNALMLYIVTTDCDNKAWRCQYLERELVHMPGLGQRPTELEHVPHAVPGQKRRASEELLNLWLV